MKEIAIAKKMLAENRIEQLLSFMDGKWQKTDTYLPQYLIPISARYNSWKKNQIQGVNADQIEINQIRVSLLDIILIWEQGQALESTQKEHNSMEYPIVRKKHLEQHVRKLSSFLMDWESKMDIAENPSEIARCEIEIKKTQKRLGQYQAELQEILQNEAPEVQELAEQDIGENKYDAFISFADQDKYSIAIPLAEALELRGKKVWLSANELKIGDSIAEEVSKAIGESHFGIIILSQNYFKAWPINELNAFFAKYTLGGQNIILPVWHNLSYEEVQRKVPLIADKLAVKSKIGIEEVVEKLIDAMEKHVLR